MASTILGVDYDIRIRNRLGVSSDDLLTSEIDEVLPATEVRIKKRIPNWQTLSADDLVLFQSATVALIAAECCSILKAKIPKSEKTPFYSADSSEDWDAKRTKLIEDAERDLGSITGYTYSDVFVNVLGVSGPTRAGVYNE